MALPGDRQPDEAPGPAPHHGSGASALARVYWMFVGNFVAGYLAFGIAQHEHRLSWRDLAFAAALASLVAVRYVDITRLAGKTGDGAPATVADWRRYSTFLLLIGVGAWILAHGVAFYTGR